MKKTALRKFFVGKYIAYRELGRSDSTYHKITNAYKEKFNIPGILSKKEPINFLYRIDYGPNFISIVQSELVKLVKERELIVKDKCSLRLLSPKQFVVANAATFIGCRYLLLEPSDYLTIEDITSDSTYPYCVAVRVRRGSFITRTETFHFPYTFFENALLSVDPRHYDNGRMRLTTL